MHTEHFGAKLTADYTNDKIPNGMVVVRNVAGRTLHIGKPAVALFPGDKGAFCDDARGLQAGIASNALKFLFVTEGGAEQVKESSSKKKKSPVIEESAPQEEVTVLETVASDAPDTSVQLGVVDVESLPSEQQEGN